MFGVTTGEPPISVFTSPQFGPARAEAVKRFERGEKVHLYEQKNPALPPVRLRTWLNGPERRR